MTADLMHAPVMLQEAVDALAPRDGGLYVDATFGAGGYSRALLGSGDVRVMAMDRDPAVRPAADRLRDAYPGRFVLVGAPFAELAGCLMEAGGPEDAHAPLIDGAVFDVGVSSMQLDRPDRGFSFRADGPLDMRMGETGPTAADVVAGLSEAQLAELFRKYGEEKRAGRAAAALVAARADAPIETTGRLAEIVAEVVGAGSPTRRLHPATRVFQALRMYVNDELGQLAAGLAAAEAVLAPGGRLAVVSFHSLEDRLVKAFFRRRAGIEPGGSRHAPAAEPIAPASFRLLFAGARTPSEQEVAENIRSRSAKLRAGVRLDTPPWPEPAEEQVAPALSFPSAAELLG